MVTRMPRLLRLIFTSGVMYKAQGFPADYILSHGAGGKSFTKTQQVHMCGNSVSPPPMPALAKANDPWRAAEENKKLSDRFI